ncbi:hypothetical protein LZ009_10155 [Ramlibacter sp. XY19]|uniref:hypothetical protein n=1 Tax=Ramlibacter paludis TaxID=2908000 RepID=UPI0023DB9C9C|nr:hypothetical protein [Ramlibacter paludis]MCG2593143.1 hypothetical protein [Ramlibacter paludis]
MTKRSSWGLAGVLLAALALGGCNKPQGGNTPQAEAGTTGAATAGAAPQPGSGLNGGLGTGMTGSFPSTSTSTGVTTGTLGNNEGSTNATPGSAVGTRP